MSQPVIFPHEYWRAAVAIAERLTLGGPFAATEALRRLSDAGFVAELDRALLTHRASFDREIRAFEEQAQSISRRKSDAYERLIEEFANRLRAPDGSDR